MEDFRIKYKNMTEINKLKAELQGVLNENAGLQQKLGYKWLEANDSKFTYI